MTNSKPNSKQALKSARRFVRAVQKAGIHLDAAFLYGSYALGTAHEHSDIDIAVISQDSTGDCWEIKTTGIPLIGARKNGKRRATAKCPPHRRTKRA